MMMAVRIEWMTVDWPGVDVYCRFRRGNNTIGVIALTKAEFVEFRRFLGSVMEFRAEFPEDDKEIGSAYRTDA